MERIEQVIEQVLVATAITGFLVILTDSNRTVTDQLISCMQRDPEGTFLSEVRGTIGISADPGFAAVALARFPRTTTSSPGVARRPEVNFHYRFLAWRQSGVASDA